MIRTSTRWLTAVVLLLGLVGVAQAMDSGAGDDTFVYRLTLFLHQVLFVFWLGPDIGVYMWSTKATNTELSTAQRVSAGKMMQAIELIPQACMSLMLTVGGILTEMMGIQHPWWQMAGIILLGPVWLHGSAVSGSSGRTCRSLRGERGQYVPSKANDEIVNVCTAWIQSPWLFGLRTIQTSMQNASGDNQ